MLENDGKAQNSYEGEIYQRRLPHYYVKGYTVFITWRVKFSLPSKIINELRQQKQEFEECNAKLSVEYQKLQKYQQDKKRFQLFDNLLASDKSLPDNLVKPEIAEIVMGSIHYWKAQRYNLHAFCIMPNHVHLLITPICNQDEHQHVLAKSMYSIKRYSARQINALLNKDGSVWARESYDHLVRNEAEMHRIVEYIKLNPVNAGLVIDWQEWPYTWLLT